MKRKISVLISVILILGLVLVGCSGSKDAPATPETPNATETPSEVKTDIVIATAVDFITMDPADANDTLSGSVRFSSKNNDGRIIWI